MSAFVPKFQDVEQSQPRTVLDWNVSRCLSAIRRADSGDLSAAADLAEQMLADDRITGVMRDRTSTIRLPLSFEPGGDRRSSGRAIKALEKDGDYWRILPPQQFVQLKRWGILLGVGVYRLRWHHKDGTPIRISGRNVPRLETWHPRALRFDYTTNRWLLRTKNSAEEIAVEEHPDEWGLYLPYGEFRPWASAPINGLRAPWMVKQYAWQDWGRASEKHGVGMLVAKGDENSTDDQRKKLAAQLRRLGREKGFALPPGWDLDMIEAGADTWKTFPGQIDAANMAFAIALVGQNLTSQVEGGSHAAAQAHLRVAGNIVAGDIEYDSLWVQENLFRPYARVNFATEDLAPSPIWNIPKDHSSRVELADKFGKAITELRSAHLRFKNPVEVAESMGLDLEEIPEDERQQPPQLAPASDDDDEEDPDDEGADDDDPKRKARTVRTAAGGHLHRASGFVEGQTYTDAVGDNAVRSARRLLLSEIGSLIEIVADADGFDSLRTRLVEHYRESMDPTELAELIEHCFVMTQVAGIAAVDKDA